MTTDRYTQPLELRQAWDELGTPAAAGFYSRLAAAPLETIVTARRVHGRGPGDRIDQILVQRVAPALRSAARRAANKSDTALPELTMEELHDRISDFFWAEALSGRQSFWEIRFNKRMRWAVNNAFRDVVADDERTRERMALRFVNGTDEAGEENPTEVFEEEVSDDADPIDDAIDKLRVEAVLAQLPPEVAQAMAVHVLMDLKVFSKNAEEQTVASTLGCSERKARDLVATGAKVVLQLLGDAQP